MQKWIDISVPLHSGMLTWPGQPAVDIHKILSITNGDLSNLSQLKLSVHTGTHMDSPYHFLPEGKDITSLNFDAVIGRAKVIEIIDNKCITASELDKADIREGERVLCKTRNSSMPWHTLPFKPDYVYLSTEGAEYLAQKNIACIGIDYPSIAGYKKNEAAAHEKLMRANVWIIEGLYLNNISPGEYEMICLPINIAGGDGAPARVIIRNVS